MNKELKTELFNIYDVVVFEDEDGTVQDCVRSIVKSSTVVVIECNIHKIYIYGKDNYEVWGRGEYAYCLTNKKITHLFTLKNDNRFYQVYPINNYYVELNKTEEQKKFTDIILKHMTNNGWSNDYTIDFWNMVQYELKVIEKMFKKYKEEMDEKN